MFHGTLCDLDGTLVDSERESGEALARALEQRHGIVIEQYDRDFVIGRSWVAIYDSMMQRYPQIRWTRDEMIAHTAELREDVIAEMGITILPGAREFLRRTNDRPRGLITGSSRAEVMQVLPLLGEDARFDIIIAAEDVSRSKPAPDGYLAAMAALGTGAYLCVEDSPAGIAAARAAGAVVVAVRAGNFGGWDQNAAHVVLDTLDQLTPSLVDQLYRDYGSAMGGAP